MKKLAFLIIIVMMLCSCAHYTKQLELVNLHDAQGITGGFFLGSGSIGSELFYICYVKDENIYRRLILNNGARIHFTKEIPYIVIAWNEITETSARWWEQTKQNTTSIDIYIPEGSIKQIYSLGDK